MNGITVGSTEIMEIVQLRTVYKYSKISLQCKPQLFCAVK